MSRMKKAHLVDIFIGNKRVMIWAGPPEKSKHGEIRKRKKAKSWKTTQTKHETTCYFLFRSFWMLFFLFSFFLFVFLWLSLLYIYFSPSLTASYEDIEVQDSAAATLKKMDGTYTNADFFYGITLDKRDQAFQTTSGYKTTFLQSIPLIKTLP